MKRIAVILVLIFIFSGCSNAEKPQEPNSTLPSMIYGENYKYGLLDGNKEKLTEAIYKSYQLENEFVIFKIADNEFEIMDFSGNSLGVFYSVDKVDEFFNPLGCYVVAKEDGVYKSFVMDTESNFGEIKEIPKIIYNIYDKNMNLAIEQPFTGYLFDYPDGRILPDSYSICGTYNGNKYIYKLVGNEYVLYEETAAGETDSEYYGYKITRYYWNEMNCCFGVNDPNGNIIFEPIYTRVNIPFEDRIILCEGSVESAECRYTLTDMSKKYIVNTIQYIFMCLMMVHISESQSPTEKTLIQNAAMKTEISVRRVFVLSTKTVRN